MMNQSKESEEIYHSEKNLKTALDRLEKMKDGENVVEFCHHLKASGLSNVRVLRYASCMTKILNELNINEAGKKDIERFVGSLNGKATTKQAYKLTLKKLFQYLRNGSTSKETKYPDEVAWIKVHVSEVEQEKESRVTSDKLLTKDDILALLKATDNARDEAMISVLNEGAFRPGEMLRMKVGSVVFLQDYCVVSTKGKTGQKRLPLVVSFRPLLKWLSVHPFKNEPNAPLLCSVDTNHRGHQLSYSHFRATVKKIVKKAGLSKDVWPYLFRHSQLTSMADKLTDSKLSLYAGWTMGTKMARKYIHWSGRDLDQSVLAIHGLAPKKEESKELTLTECPRCSKKNTPSSPRCESCGFILDKKLAFEAEEDLLKRVGRLEELVRGTLASSPSAL